MVMKPEQTIDFHLRWAWAKTSRLYNAEAAKLGGSMSIGYALLSIDRDGTPSTKLGPKMGMEPTSLSRLLKNMEDLGLVRRESDTSDKRIVRIVLTKAGSKMRDITKARVIQFNEYMQERIDPDKLSTFFEVIQQINGLLEADIFQNVISTADKR
jgi:DNA-binding MarR family transcriptional regulator